MATMCLRRTASSDEDGEESSFPDSTTYFSCSQGDSEVFLQENAFGSFTSFPVNNSAAFSFSPTFIRNIKSSSSSKSSHRSSSSDSSISGRQGSVKRFFKRHVSLTMRSKSEHELSSFSTSEYNSPLNNLKESLLYVFRNNTMPQQGLCRFQEMLAELVFSGGGMYSMERWWKGDVVLAGMRIVAVTVASPKDGDRISALLSAWRLLYTTTLPLLQTLMAPLNSLCVRSDVLEAFRDTVLPYAGLTASLSSKSQQGWKMHHWKLKQMLLILARLGPCRCQIGLNDEIRSTSFPSPLTDRATEPKSSSVLDVGDLPAFWDTHSINEILSIFDSKEMKDDRISKTVLEQILHLHHGGGTDFDSIYNQQITHLKRLEVPPSPGHWLTRNPVSVDTLEELLKRSAAARDSSKNRTVFSLSSQPNS